MLFPRLIERHADEASFLWDQRERAVRSPVFDLRSLTLLDHRLDANLEGLLVAKEKGLEACLSLLRRASATAWGGAGELFAATFVAAELGDVMTLAKLLLLTGGKPQGERAVVSAFGWLSPTSARKVLSELSALECPPALQRLAVAGFAARREDPGEWLTKSLESEDVGVRGRAYRAAGELGRRDLLPALRKEVRALGTEADPWALWTAVLFGEVSAVPLLFRIAESGGKLAEKAASLAARTSLDGQEVDAKLQELVSLGQWEAALAGAEARADSVSVPWVLALMETEPRAARRAAWVYSTITGAKLEEPLVAGSLVEEAAEQAVARRLTDVFEDLPAPHVGAIREHWSQVESNFPPGERRLGGQVVGAPVLAAMLAGGPQPWREGAAIELARHSGSGGVFPVRAPGFRQVPSGGARAAATQPARSFGAAPDC